jgi:hypothetical protein
MATTTNFELQPLSFEALHELATLDADRVLTLTMPTHRAGHETRQDSIRYKNLIQKSEERIRAGGFSSAVVERLLTPLNDHEFWSHQDSGLAVVATADSVQFFHLDEPPEEYLVIGRRPAIAPLVPWYGSLLELNVLLLTWQHADLKRMVRGRFEAESVGDFPLDIDNLVTPNDPEEQLQFSSAGGASGSTPLYHSQGEGERSIEARRELFLSRVSKRVDEFVGANPLVVVATQEVAGHFRSVSNVETMISVQRSPGSDPLHHLESPVKDAIDEWTTQQRSDLEERYAAAFAGERVFSDSANAVTEAIRGRVDQLLIAEGAELPGRVHQDSGVAAIDADGDEDLINVAVVETLRHGGEVQRVKEGHLPGKAKKLVAMLRF